LSQRPTVEATASSKGECSASTPIEYTRSNCDSARPHAQKVRFDQLDAAGQRASDSAGPRMVEHRPRNVDSYHRCNPVSAPK
jgi:hypothetical protein